MSGDKIILVVKGLGHVPSKKNNKMLTRGRLITKPEYQKWIEWCILDFVSQLSSMSQTEEGAMLMERSRQSLMCWLKHYDDSLDWVCEMNVKAHPRIVAKGTEGAIVILEQL